MISHVLYSMNETVSYNYSAAHQALDIVGSSRSISDIIAYDDGVIEIVADNFKGVDNSARGTASYGNFVKIKHFNGMKTLYAHLKYGSIKVQKGSYVKKGQIIGTMGNTGNTYGTHLHFEVMNNNDVRQNPYNYLWGAHSYFKSNYSGRSLVDGLRSIGANSSFDYRKVLAIKNGISNYTGTYNQNATLLNLLKQGKLIKAY